MRTPARSSHVTLEQVSIQLSEAKVGFDEGFSMRAIARVFGGDYDEHRRVFNILDRLEQQNTPP